MPATGRRRPISVLADKATPVHRTLQMVSVITVIAGRVTSVMLGAHRVVFGTTGVELANGIITQTNKYGISMPEQCHGFSFDGQYLYLGVPKALCNATVPPLTSHYPSHYGTLRIEWSWPSPTLSNSETQS